MTKEEILCRISVLLGGRSAEKIIYGNVSTGASDDIEKVSILITKYTNSWGMNETIGPLNPDVMGNIGKQLNNNIMTRCKDIIEDIENQTIKILKKYKQHMEIIAKDLLENETIEYDRIKNLISNKRIENSKEIKFLEGDPKVVTH